IAVSITSSPALIEIWGMISTNSPSEIFDRISGFGAPATQFYLSGVYSSNPLEAAKKIMDKSRSASIRTFTYWDDSFPQLLREIHMPPLVLYVRGDIEADRAAAVVGTRNSCPRSAANARRIAGDLAS